MIIDLEAFFPLKNISIYKAYVFGGYLVDNNSKDIDLLVISEDFEGVSRLKRNEKVNLNFSSKLIDPVCLTVKEYERLVQEKSVFLNMILANASKIYERDFN